MSIQRCCAPTALVDDDFAEQAGLLKALADPHRLAIVATLVRAENEVCVCDFTSGLPLNQPAVSHHLKILRDSGLVACERRGTWVYYRLADDARERLTSALQRVFEQEVLA
jgi:ArsR family transcriptional regulator